MVPQGKLACVPVAGAATGSTSCDGLTPPWLSLGLSWSRLHQFLD